MNLATMTRRSDRMSRQRRRSFAAADEPLGYVDGPNVYGVEKGNPVSGTDPMGLADGKGPRALADETLNTLLSDPGTIRVLAPISPLQRHMEGYWGTGENQIGFELDAQPINPGPANASVAFVAKVKKVGCTVDDFRWLQYTITSQNGVMPPPNGHNAGLDRASNSNTGRPYVDNDGVQNKINAGTPPVWRFPPGVVYDPEGWDSVFVDPAGTGDVRPYYHHLSYVALVGRMCVDHAHPDTFGPSQEDYVIATFAFEFWTDGSGRLATYGFRDAPDALPVLLKELEGHGWDNFYDDYLGKQPGKRPVLQPGPLPQ